MTSFTYAPFDITETSLPPVLNDSPSPRLFPIFDDAELEAAVDLIPQTISTTFPTQPIPQYQQLPNDPASIPPVTCSPHTLQPDLPPSPRPLPPSPDPKPHASPRSHPSPDSHPSTHAHTPPTNPSSSTISTPPNSTPPLLPPSNSLLSAVDLAKRAAEQITIAELAKKRRNPDGVPIAAKRHKPNTSASDDDDEHPERVSHRKYQKRLQKNRDSAFVSRIRRREYTRILEKSLSAVEKEKNEAVNRFLDMKRRFELVSAELNGMRRVAQSGFAQLRDSVIAKVALPDSTADNSDPARPRGAVTMFMFALMFGVLIPDMDSRTTGATSVATKAVGLLRGNAKAERTGAYVASGVGDATKGRKGSVWGGAAGVVERADMRVLPLRQLVLASVRADLQAVLGDGLVEEAMERIEGAVQQLSDAEMAGIHEAVLEGRERYGVAAERVWKVVEQLREKSAERELDELSEQLGRVELAGDR